MICILHHVLFRDQIKETKWKRLGTFGEMRNVRKVLVGKSEEGLGMLHVWGRREVYTGFWWENLRERDHSEDPGVDGKIIRWIFRKRDVGTLTGLIWLRIGISDGHL
jgi:hypothetical protein